MSFCWVVQRLAEKRVTHLGQADHISWLAYCQHLAGIENHDPVARSLNKSHIVLHNHLGYAEVFFDAAQETRQLPSEPVAEPRGSGVNAENP